MIIISERQRDREREIKELGKFWKSIEKVKEYQTNRGNYKPEERLIRQGESGRKERKWDRK